MSVEKEPRPKLFNLSNPNLIKLADSALGMSNRPYRRAWQNVVDKIFLVPSLAEMSAVHAHGVIAAQASYLNSYVYSSAERVVVLAKMKAQLAASARP